MLPNPAPAAHSSAAAQPAGNTLRRTSFPAVSQSEYVVVASMPMKHVLTKEYLADKFPSVSAAQMAPWLTWATSTGVESTSLRSVGIKTILYTNPNRQAPGGPMYTNDETTFAHDCQSQRIQFSARNNVYLMNPASTHLRKLWKNAVTQAGGEFDAIFDDTPNELFGVTSLPCKFDQSSWTADLNTLNYSLGLPIVYNGLGNIDHTSSGSWVMSQAFQLNPSTIGGTMEGCYSALDLRNPKPHSDVWKTQEDTEIKMALVGKRFICRGFNVAPAAQAISARLYMVASFLLTYNQNTSILSEKFSTPSNFRVEPESEFVPTMPVRATPSGIAALRQNSGVYGREYTVCYLNGSPVGGCAIAVNSDPRTEKYPWPTKYHHTLLLSGGGILDGGKVSAAGPAPLTYVDALSAVIGIQ